MADAVGCFGKHLPGFSFGRTPATPEDGRVPAIGPIPLRSIGPMAGIVGVLSFYRQEVALAYVRRSNLVSYEKMYFFVCIFC